MHIYSSLNVLQRSSTYRELFSESCQCIYQIWIVITLFRYIQPQSKYRLVLNLSEKGNYTPNSVQIDKIPKRFLCVFEAVQENLPALGKHGNPIEKPPETPRTSQHYRTAGLNRVVLIQASMRCASLSYSCTPDQCSNSSLEVRSLQHGRGRGKLYFHILSQ